MTSPAQLGTLLIEATKIGRYHVNSELAEIIHKAAQTILDCQVVGMDIVTSLPKHLPDETLFLAFVNIVIDERFLCSRAVVACLEELCDDIILYDPGGYSADDDDEDDEE